MEIFFEKEARYPWLFVVFILKKKSSSRVEKAGTTRSTKAKTKSS